MKMLDTGYLKDVLADWDFGDDEPTEKIVIVDDVCCNHEYIPLFTSYMCKHCGKARED